MKIVAINGSPKGKSSNTNRMVTALLKGAQEAGAETVNVFLVEKNIKYCTGCQSCRYVNPGQCVLEDDMAEIIALCEGADVRVLATPLYTDIISSRLKVFMERMIVTINPYFQKDENGECRHVKGNAVLTPKLMMIANSGFPERSQFQLMSHWIKRVARNMDTEVIGEIYCAQGAILQSKKEVVRPMVLNYINALEEAGKEIAINMSLSEKTKKLLEQRFIPDEIYIKNYNSRIDAVFPKSIL